MLQQLLRPLGWAGPASALPPGVCDQQLSYLLDLVKEKRISAAQAQQVADGTQQGRWESLGWQKDGAGEADQQQV